MAYKSQHEYQRIHHWYSQQQGSSAFETLCVPSMLIDEKRGRKPTKLSGTKDTTSKMHPCGK
jgi:hypothetical protein